MTDSTNLASADGQQIFDECSAYDALWAVS